MTFFMYLILIWKFCHIFCQNLNVSQHLTGNCRKLKNSAQTLKILQFFRLIRHKHFSWADLRNEIKSSLLVNLAVLAYSGTTTALLNLKFGKGPISYPGSYLRSPPPPPPGEGKSLGARLVKIRHSLKQKTD